MLSWWAGGIGIGLVLIIAVALVQPIGVSTQYVVLDGVLLHSCAPGRGIEESLPGQDRARVDAGYLRILLCIGDPVGCVRWQRWPPRASHTRVVPVEWGRRFGSNPGNRLVWSFVGGFLLLFGARFGGGCTSGHMISGISQLAISSFVFSAALFISGIITARALYRDGG